MTGALRMMGALWAAVALSAVPAFAQQKEVDELLAVDRAYAAASAKTDLVSGLTAMFSTGVIMPVPGPGAKFAEGVAAATEILRANAGNAQSRAEWTPIRGGISADGQQGFTFGYMTIHRGDGSDAPAKYLAYWAKENGRWKVAAYKRAGRPAGEVSLALMPPSLPARIVPPTTDSVLISGFAASLAAAEKAFSDEAAIIGLGPAFEKHGRADAMNIGRQAAFTFGNMEIAKGVSPTPTQPSALVWGADYRIIVASSGDLGVSIGFIRNKADPAATPFPFFTIWRRESPAAPWRYIAE
jgi:ketosteroid isomerase-like protein